MFDLKEDDLELDLKGRIKSSYGDFGPQVLIVILLKLGIIAIGPGALKLKEIHHIQSLNKQLAQAQSQVQSVEQEVQSIEAEIKKYESSKEKKKDFENKERILTQLAQKRLKIISILDHLQQVVDTVVDAKKPTVFMFLDRINVNNKDIRIDGMANDDTIVNQFLFQLEDESLYSSVHLEQVSSQRDSLKKFLVKGSIRQDEEEL